MKEVNSMTRYFLTRDEAYEFIDRCGWRYDDYEVSTENGMIKVVLF